MIRVGVVSDSHGDLRSLEACMRKAGEVDCWFHLGDFASDAKALAASGRPVYSVYGNCDGFFGGEAIEDAYPASQKAGSGERVVTIGGARILLMHGHRYGVDLGTLRASYRAEELNCAAVLYGHTHRAELSAFGPVLVLNPGSTSRPRGGRASFAVLEVEKGSVNAELIIL
ncbi:MAG: metallophosphoesterase [Clostridia bacterium]|nr:metallophosphoesterase [Clostridia bacterium]MBQ2517729.1 metallophosphoesterase [Clostridia bacterium]MBQ4341953.1 metallophosphoesterase [Clostridia bacterium]